MHKQAISPMLLASEAQSALSFVVELPNASVLSLLLQWDHLVSVSILRLFLQILPEKPA